MLSAQNRAVSLAAQPGAVFVAPSNSDYTPCANLTLDTSSVTVDNPEYTGNIHRPGPDVIGEKVTLTMRFLLRPPGGANPPAAGIWVPGRALTACGFTENVVSAAIPAAAEALSAGTTTQATLGAGAAATADIYKGMSVNLLSNGAYPKSLTAVRAYTAAKVATFPETFGAALTGNYQIPRQLGYIFSDATPTQRYMARVHFDKVNFDLINMMPTRLQIVANTAGINNADLSYFEVTFDAEVAAWGDTAAPTVTLPTSGLPMFRCGDQWVANKALGGTGFTIAIDYTTERPPNPNTCNGDPAEVTATKRGVQLNLNHNLKADIDIRDLALVTKSYNSLWAQFGQAAGNICSIIVTDARFDVPNITENGAFVGQSVNMMIDAALRAIAISFPY